MRIRNGRNCSRAVIYKACNWKTPKNVFLQLHTIMVELKGVGLLSTIFSYYGSQWCPKTAWLQTFFRISSFVFGKTKTFIQVWNYSRVSKWQNFQFWVNYPFNHASLYFNMNRIGPRVILKEYSAVVVVTKLLLIWLTDKLHALTSVLFFLFCGYFS